MALQVLPLVALVLLASTSFGQAQPRLRCFEAFSSQQPVTFDQIFNRIEQKNWWNTLYEFYCMELNQAEIPPQFPALPELHELYLSIPLIRASKLALGCWLVTICPADYQRI